MQILIQPRSLVSPILDPELLDAEQAPELARSALGQARLVLMAWAIQFEGRPRERYDAHRLRELIGRLLLVRIELSLAQLQHPSGPLRGYLDTLDHELRLLSGEAERSRLALGQGDAALRASVLGQRLSDQMAVYAAHCAERPRDARRPGLLRRILANLEELAEHMEHADLVALPAEHAHHRNLDRVRRYREVLRLEAAKVAAVVFELSPRARFTALFRELAVLRAEAGAAAPGSPDGARLLADRLDEVAVQLGELARQHREPGVEELLQQVQSELLARHHARGPRAAAKQTATGPYV